MTPPADTPAPAPPDPSALRLRLYPEPVLLEKARPVEVPPRSWDEVARIAARMIEVMRSAEGIGLAAPQVGLSWRMFVCHVPPEEERSDTTDPPTACAAPQVFVNPEILRYELPPELGEEGCLSLPGIRGDVLRPPIVTVRAQDETGTWHERRAGGLLARCWQHEIDHLDGVLILNRMTQMSRLRARTAVRRMQRVGR